MMDYAQLALELHKKYKGKIQTSLRDVPDSKDKLSAYYSPGVGAVSSYVAAHPDELRDYSWTNNLVAIISDGSAVLGLGDIGPYGAMPVMEGKAMLFKHFADIDAVPIVLDVHEPDEIIAAITAIAPSFGAINLEDISAPKCFAIEDTLKNKLRIPIMHDDQHGTAIVVLAGLINATKLAGKALDSCRITVVGAGAAGTAVVKLIKSYAHGVKITLVDSKGIITSSRNDLNEEKKALLHTVDFDPGAGNLEEAIKDADIFIGVSKAGLLQESHVKSMADKPIIFALANPNPEITPDDAHAAGAFIVATGRSDFPNQINNALAFPGIFRGALDNGVSAITEEHKLAAAEAIASLVVAPSQQEIIPSILDDRLVGTVARVIH